MASDDNVRDDEDEKRAGLEPEEFQRRLIAVTATVLILGVVGGTCLGTKIEEAERIQQSDTAGSQPTPAERANPPSESR